jgi:O-antigen/teichoic acid export membrane protein
VIKLRLALAVFVFSIGVGIFYFFLDKSLVFIYLILGMQLFIYSFHIFRQWYQIKSLNKYTVIASQAGFLCISIAKIVLILFVKDIIWYAFILTGGSFIEMFFLFYFFKKKSGNKSIEKFDIKYARHLLHSSLPLLFQNFAVFIYMRIDQLMIGKMLSVDRLGIYSVAVSIAEIVNIVPMAIINAAYPKIVLAKKEGRDYETLLVKIGSLNISLCLLFAAGCTIFAPYFITKLYGAAYADAGRVIQIYSWASVFTAVGVSHSCFITFNNMQKYSLIAISIAATMNVIGNFIFIPLLGINGAAITTVLSYSVAAYFFYAFIKDKQTFYLRTKSLFVRWG